MDGAKLIKILGRLYPKKLKEWYDRVGKQTITVKGDVKTILLALDYDEEVFKKALEIKPDLIITHHPFIFGTKGKVFKSDPLKEELYNKTVEQGFPVYSYHTNFDNAKNGMNDALSEVLGLVDVEVVETCPGMRIGSLKEMMEVYDVPNYVMERLHATYSHLLPYGKKEIKTVGIIGGAGSGLWKVAEENGADIYLSGDCPHHVRRDIIRYGYNYLDLPHEIERIFIPKMTNILLNIDQSLNVISFDHEVEALTFKKADN